MLLPHLLKDGRGRLDVYFTRVYNPVWTNPDGFTWIEALSDEKLVGLHVALTPTWSETAYFADYVLPMGLGAERHDLHSYETHDAQWLGFRQPVLRAARRAARGAASRTREPSTRRGVGRERVLDRALVAHRPRRFDGHSPTISNRRRHLARSSALDEYYGFIFENSVPGLPERAAREGLDAARVHAPLRKLRSEEEGRRAARGAVSGSRARRRAHRRPRSRLHAAPQSPLAPNVVPLPTPDPDAEGRRLVGVEIDGRFCADFRLRAGVWSSIPRRSTAGGGRSTHCRPTSAATFTPSAWRTGQMVLIPTFRMPVQIHTRSANAKWLDEIAHTNPLWIHPRDAERARAAHGRAGSRRDRDRLLRREGLGHRRHPPGSRRLQPSHGALEARGQTGSDR